MQWQGQGRCFLNAYFYGKKNEISTLRVAGFWTGAAII
jgi:hypothetical protein